MQEKQAPEVWQRLTDLFPPDIPKTSTTSTDEATGHSSWTPQVIARVTRLAIQSHFKAGWKYVEGMLEKGQHRKRVPEVVYQRVPGELSYNPRTDAPAVRRDGGVLIEAGEWAGYYMGASGVMDRHGSLVDKTLCPECGGSPYRVRVQNPNPFAQPWEQSFTYCRRCVTLAMLAENERRVQGSAPTEGRRR